MSGGPTPRTPTQAEVRVLDAVKACCERWGVEKVTIDDIAKQSGVSRATLYRMFPGGKEVLFEAHRVYELDQFFGTLLREVQDTTDLEELLARTVSVATRELRNDEHLARMLATEPGVVVSELTVEGLPRIIRVATAYMVPLVEPYLPRRQARDLIDMVARLVISYFLAPNDGLDLADEAAARRFITPFLQLTTTPSPTTGAPT